MRTQALSPPLQALYRVFVQPSLAQRSTTTTAARQLSTLVLRPVQSTSASASASTSTRTSGGNASADDNRPSASSRPFSTTGSRLAATRAPEKRTQLWDDEIRARYIAVVDPVTKALSAPQPRREVLASYDRRTHRLVCVSAPPPPEEAAAGAHGWTTATCRLVSKKEQYELDKARQKARGAARRSSAEANAKTLELNWAIDEHDLGHRCRRVREFLEGGRRVEVVFARKKGGRRATGEECEEAVRKIVEAALSVPGAKQAKKMEGKLGAVATLFFEGPKKVAEKEKGKIAEEEKGKVVEKEMGQGKAGPASGPASQQAADA
ncbi:hypothetical protein MBLNU459_g4752t1 [Dothideomycetes sp. NU459]